MSDQRPKRGFAAMSLEERRKAAAKGGRALKPEQRSFSKNRALASECGRVGGTSVDPENRSFSRDRALAIEAGRKGGKATRRLEKT